MREELIDFHETVDEAESGKMLVSLTEKRLYGDAAVRHTWYDLNRFEFSNNYCTDYTDTATGHVSAVSTYSTRASLKQKGVAKNAQAAAAKAKPRPGHNQHFRGIQRKNQMVKTPEPREWPVWNR